MPPSRLRPHRRALLCGLGALAWPGAEAWARTAGTTAFEVWRKGQRIGSHAVELRDGAGGGWTARITATLLVRLGPIPVFRYRHEATEVWSAPDQFAALDSRTTSNGKVETVAARRGADGVRIARSGGPPLLAAPRAAPLTHWNRDALSRPLFNPQTGALVREAVSRRPDPALLADGRTIPATAYALTGDAQITDWYDDAGAWAALRGKAPDGSWLEYRRLG